MAVLSTFVLMVMMLAVPSVALATAPTIDPSLDVNYERTAGIANGKMFYVSTDGTRVCMINLATGADGGCGPDLSNDYEVLSIAAVDDQVYVLLKDWAFSGNGSIRSVNQADGELGATRFSFSEGDGYYDASALIASDGQLFAWATDTSFNRGYLRFTTSGGALTLGGFSSDMANPDPVDVAVGGGRIITAGSGFVSIFDLDSHYISSGYGDYDNGYFRGLSYDPAGNRLYALGFDNNLGDASVSVINPTDNSSLSIDLPSELNQFPSDLMVVGDSLYILAGNALMRMNLTTLDYSIETFPSGYSADGFIYYDPDSTTIWLNVWNSNASTDTFIGYEIADLGGDPGAGGGGDPAEPGPKLPTTIWKPGIDDIWDSANVISKLSLTINEEVYSFTSDPGVITETRSESVPFAEGMFDYSSDQFLGSRTYSINGRMLLVEGHGAELSLCFDVGGCVETLSIGDLYGSTVYNNVEYEGNGLHVGGFEPDGFDLLTENDLFMLSWLNVPEGATEFYLKWRVGSEVELTELTLGGLALDGSNTLVEVTPVISVTAPALLDFGPGVPGDELTVTDVVNVSTNSADGYTLTSDWTGMIGNTSSDTIADTALSFTLDGNASSGALARTPEGGTDHDLDGVITIPFVDTDTYNGSITFTATSN